jgi:hypothetical protein
MALSMCAASAMLAIGLSTAGVASASNTNPAPTSSAGGQRPTLHVLAEAVWGVNAQGQPFMHVIKGRIVGNYSLRQIKTAYERSLAAHKTKATPNVPAITTACYEVMGNISKALGNVPFYWTIQQTCHGSYYEQNMSTQLWRSSYRGPLGYSSWVISHGYLEDFIDQTWKDNCNWDTGNYKYNSAGQGWAEGIGFGPIITSPNFVNTANCGGNGPIPQLISG